MVKTTRNRLQVHRLHLNVNNLRLKALDYRGLELGSAWMKCYTWTLDAGALTQRVPIGIHLVGGHRNGVDLGLIWVKSLIHGIGFIGVHNIIW